MRAILGGLLLGLLPMSAAAQVTADWADAPDATSAGYPIPFQHVIALFPTHPGTATSRYHLPGLHVLDTTKEWLGQESSGEAGILDCVDSDGRMNYIDNDSDDGLINPPCPLDTAMLAPPPALVPSKMTVRVQLAPDAAPGPRYLNVLIDQNNDGEWRDRTEPYPLREWVTRDFVVNLAPGNAREYQLGIDPGSEFGLLITPTPKWIRVALTTQPVTSVFVDDGSGWDGGGEFAAGEAEDYLVSGVIAATAIAADAQSASDTAFQAATAAGSITSTVHTLATSAAAVNISAEILAVSQAQARALTYVDSISAACSATAGYATAATESRVLAQVRFDQLVALCGNCNACPNVCQFFVSAATLFLAAAKSAELAAVSASQACTASATYAQAQADACTQAVSEMQVQAILLSQAGAAAGVNDELALEANAVAQAHASASAEAYATARLRACGQDIDATAEATAEANAEATATATVMIQLAQRAEAVAQAYASAGAVQQAAIAVQSEANSAAAAALGALSVAESVSFTASFAALSVQHAAGAMQMMLVALQNMCDGACGPVDPPGICPDIDGDGLVGLSDLAILLSQFGGPCLP